MRLGSGSGLQWLGAAALLLAALWLRSGLLLLAAGLVALVAGVVALWRRFGLSRLTYERHFQQNRCFPGEPVTLTVTVTNRKVLPLTYLVVEESVPVALEVESRRLHFQSRARGRLRMRFSLGWYQRVERRFTVRATRRGAYRLGPAVVAAGDPFGWAEQRMEVAPSDLLIVYPRVVPLEEVGLPAQRPFGDLASRDRLFADPLRFAGVREYRPGDPLNQVHWKATAATGELQVRLLDPSASLGLAVFLNTWSYERFWEGDDADALEAGVTLAASIVGWAHEHALPVGLYANGLVYGWGFSLHLPPARGDGVLVQALEGLARLQTGSPQPLWELMAAEVPALPYGTSLVVITRQVGVDLAGAVLRAQRSGRPVTLVVTGPEAEPVPELPGVRVYRVGGEEGLHGAVLAE